MENDDLVKRTTGEWCIIGEFSKKTDKIQSAIVSVPFTHFSYAQTIVCMWVIDTSAVHLTYNQNGAVSRCANSKRLAWNVIFYVLVSKFNVICLAICYVKSVNISQSFNGRIQCAVQSNRPSCRVNIVCTFYEFQCLLFVLATSICWIANFAMVFASHWADEESTISDTVTVHLLEIMLIVQIHYTRADFVYNISNFILRRLKCTHYSQS